MLYKCSHCKIIIKVKVHLRRGVARKLRLCTRISLCQTGNTRTRLSMGRGSCMGTALADEHEDDGEHGDGLDEAVEGLFGEPLHYLDAKVCTHQDYGNHAQVERE